MVVQYDGETWKSREKKYAETQRRNYQRYNSKNMIEK